MAWRLAILTPVLDDWPSLSELISEINAGYSADDAEFELIAVDDGSSTSWTAETGPSLPLNSCIKSVSVIQLALNLGHQRAIAVGLASLSERTDLDGVVVMDSDGEDRPSDLAILMAMSRTHPAHVIMARRAERSETTVFKIGYQIYKTLFRLLSGHGISFGNFCLLPMPAVHRLAHMPELWNNLPATIIRSRLRHCTVQTKRGKRYTGQSKMNLPALVVHGLSAMSVYTDIIFVRVLLAAFGLCAVSIVSIISVVMIRLTTTWAIPGWATTVVGDLLIILIQALILLVAITLMLLANRSARQLVPITDTTAFIAERQLVASRQPAREAPVNV